MRLNVTLDGDIVKAAVEPVKGGRVSFSAERITRQRTGTHALITITLNTEDVLVFSYFNTDRNSERVSLHNSAYVMMPKPLNQAYSRPELKADLDQFCMALWATFTIQFQAELAEGNPDSTVEWYCPPLVMRDAATIVFAPGGSGKSQVAMTAAVSINYGISNIWHPMISAPVLYINLERSHQSMTMRLAGINAALGLRAEDPLLMLTARGRTLDAIYEGAARSINQHEVEVVVLDSISRTGAGDLNENEPANQIMNMLNSLSKTWLAVAHTPAENKGKIFGPEMFRNAADLTVKLASEEVEAEEKLGISLEIVKANDTRRGQRHFLAYEFNGLGVQAIRRTDLAEFPELAVDRRMSNIEMVRTFLQNHPDGAATSTEIAEALELNRNNLYRILTFVKLPKQGKEQPYGLASEDRHGPSVS